MSGFNRYAIITAAVALLGLAQTEAFSDTPDPESKAGAHPASEPPSRDRGLYSTDLPTPDVAGAEITVIPQTRPPKVNGQRPRRPTPAAQTTGKSASQARDDRRPTTSAPAQTAASPVRKQADQAPSPPLSSGAVPVSTESERAQAVINARLNKPGPLPRYKVGEKLAVEVSALVDCNVVVFNYDSSGGLKQIFPNEYQQNHFIKAGESVSIGGPDSPFDYEIGGHPGQEKIFVYAYPSTSSNPLTVAMNVSAHSPFRSATMSPDEYQKLVDGSEVFFAREVKIVPKSGVQPVAHTTSSAPNKIELSFLIEPR